MYKQIHVTYENNHALNIEPLRNEPRCSPRTIEELIDDDDQIDDSLTNNINQVPNLLSNFNPNSSVPNVEESYILRSLRNPTDTSATKNASNPNME